MYIYHVEWAISDLPDIFALVQLPLFTKQSLLFSPINIVEDM